MNTLLYINSLEDTTSNYSKFLLIDFKDGSYGNILLGDSHKVDKINVIDGVNQEFILGEQTTVSFLDVGNCSSNNSSFYNTYCDHRQSYNFAQFIAPETTQLNITCEKDQLPARQQYQGGQDYTAYQQAIFRHNDDGNHRPANNANSPTSYKYIDPSTTYYNSNWSYVFKDQKYWIEFHSNPNQRTFDPLPKYMSGLFKIDYDSIIYEEYNYRDNIYKKFDNPFNNFNIFMNLFEKNKKMNIIYNGQEYELKWFYSGKDIFKSIDINCSEPYYCYLKFPEEVPLTPNTIYPIVIDDRIENSPPIMINIENILNRCSFGLPDPITEEIFINGFNPVVELKNKPIFQNYSIFKDLLFKKGISEDTTTDLRCNIYFDSTVIYSDIIVGTDEWVTANIYILVKYDIDKVFYEMQHSNHYKSQDFNEVEIGLTDSTQFNIPYINKEIMTVIVGTDEWNSLIFDRGLDYDDNSDNMKILSNHNQYKKFSDLINYEELYNNKNIETQLNNIDYSRIGYPYEIKKQYIFSDTGQFNKLNENIFSLVQFFNLDATNLIYNTTHLMELKYDGTNYDLINIINIPFNITDMDLKDSIYYGNGLQYIELFDNIESVIVSYFIDIYNNKFLYQGNLDPKDMIDGLLYYPVNDLKSDVIYLNSISYSYVDIDNKTISGQKSVYNYNMFINNFNGSFTESMESDVVCPYNNIFISEDYKYLFLELNDNSLLHNLNNKTLVNITERNSAMITHNSSAMYFDGVSEIIKIDNEFINITSLDSDDIIVDNNQKSEENEYIPIISYDQFNYEEWFGDIFVMEQEIPINREVYLLMQLKEDSAELINSNYPDIILLYKKANESEFRLIKNINNVDTVFISRYYKMKRFLMKKETTQLTRIIEFK